MKKENFNNWVLLLLVFFISALFLSMIRQFLMAIFLAGIFSALSYPLYQRLAHRLGNRRAMASIITIVLILFLILIPLTFIVGIVTAQALKVGQTVQPWVQKQMAQSDQLFELLRSFPILEKIEPYRSVIISKAGQVVSSISTFLINKLSSITLGTVHFVLMSFVMLYTMFFFLVDGDKLLEKILYYLPLKDHDERRMLDKFTSVTRATLKGTAAIGILQGGLAGLAFAVAGIPSAVFWGAIMAVLSIIPGIGSALIWCPAAIILAATGQYVKAVGLALFCAVVVGSLDNLLRPILVGKDTQMHELMIFFGTLGGIFMFGMAGIFIGPIIAALFITVWDIYGISFKDYLPAVTVGTSAVQESDRNASDTESQ